MTPRLFGPRNVVEAAFLVAVPVVSLAAGLGPWPIIGAATAAYLIVFALEASIARLAAAAEKRPQPVAPEPPPAEILEPEPEWRPERVVEPEPDAEPEPEDEPTPKVEPTVRVLPSRPKPPPPAPPEPRRTNVVSIGIPGPARRWSIWELERVTKEATGRDPAADEERQFLLLYLREFADADGLLPFDFDRLVRDSFGELVTR